MKSLVVIVGPTSSGKSALAVQLAKKFHGEIISADSRQVYKGLDIGSGKITQKERMGILHHLLDVASPKRRFTVSDYQKLAGKAILDIQKRNKLPFLVGGSPFYIYAVVDGWTIPEAKPNPLLRKTLEKLSAQELFLKLKKFDPERARTIERKNKRRLIRALEIVLTTGKPVPPMQKNVITTTPWCNNEYVFIGIKKSPQELKKLIAQRLEKRLRGRNNMIAEVQKLYHSGLSWKRLEEFGLEYRYIAQYLQGKLTLNEMKEKLQKASIDFSRRQMSWFKKDKRIHWIENTLQAEKLLEQFT